MSEQPQIHMPNNPATNAQKNLINKLYEKGILTSNEITNFMNENNGHPTVQDAHKTIEHAAQHPDYADVRKQIQDEIKYVKIKIAHDFVKDYIRENENGTKEQRAIVNIPPNTKINGIDATGYSFDIPFYQFQLDQKINGKPINISINENEKITLFKGSRKDGTYQELTDALSPWELTKALKQSRENYIQQQQQNRQETSQSTPSKPSLGDVAQESRASASHFQQQQTQQRNVPQLPDFITENTPRF